MNKYTDKDTTDIDVINNVTFGGQIIYSCALCKYICGSVCDTNSAHIILALCKFEIISESEAMRALRIYNEESEGQLTNDRPTERRKTVQ